MEPVQDEEKKIREELNLILQYKSTNDKIGIEIANVLKEELMEGDDLYLKYYFLAKSLKIGLRSIIMFTSKDFEKDLLKLRENRLKIKSAELLKEVDEAINLRVEIIENIKGAEENVIKMFDEFQTFIKEINRCPNNHYGQMAPVVRPAAVPPAAAVAPVMPPGVPCRGIN